MRDSITCFIATSLNTYYQDSNQRPRDDIHLFRETRQWEISSHRNRRIMLGNVAQTYSVSVVDQAPVDGVIQAHALPSHGADAIVSIMCIDKSCNATLKASAERKWGHPR